jgi:hypothetical protein
VSYGRVEPPPLPADDSFRIAYEWLGQHCGYHPQIWLARSRSAITGFRGRAGDKGNRDRSILFGFEGIQGFPVAYDFWCELLSALLNAGDIESANKAVATHLEWTASLDGWESDPVAVAWRESRDVGAVLDRHLFVEVDQVVLPAVNLKAAKEIVCRDESNKKALRRLGFIEDRIRIRNVPPWS